MFFFSFPPFVRASFTRRASLPHWNSPCITVLYSPRGFRPQRPSPCAKVPFSPRGVPPSTRIYSLAHSCFTPTGVRFPAQWEFDSTTSHFSSWDWAKKIVNYRPFPLTRRPHYGSICLVTTSSIHCKHLLSAETAQSRIVNCVLVWSPWKGSHTREMDSYWPFEILAVHGDFCVLSHTKCQP